MNLAVRSWNIGFRNQIVMKILQKPTLENIEEQLMSSPVDSLVSLFPMPVEGGARGPALSLAGNAQSY